MRLRLFCLLYFSVTCFLSLLLWCVSGFFNLTLSIFLYLCLILLHSLNQFPQYNDSFDSIMNCNLFWTIFDVPYTIDCGIWRQQKSSTSFYKEQTLTIVLWVWHWNWYNNCCLFFFYKNKKLNELFFIFLICCCCGAKREVVHCVKYFLQLSFFFRLFSTPLISLDRSIRHTKTHIFWYNCWVVIVFRWACFYG